jgi:hypothetical protein
MGICSRSIACLEERQPSPRFLQLGRSHMSRLGAPVQ